VDGKVLVCAPSNAATLNLFAKYAEKHVAPQAMLDIIFAGDAPYSVNKFDGAYEAALGTRTKLVCRALKTWSDLEHRAETDEANFSAAISGNSSGLPEIETTPIGELVMHGIEELGSLGIAICGEDVLCTARAICCAAATAAAASDVVDRLLFKAIRPILAALRTLVRADHKKERKMSVESLVESNLLSRARVIFSTVCSSGKTILSSELFCVAVIDEAAMCEEALSLIVLRPETNRLIIVGDTKQLPATVFSEEAKSAGYARSLMERLQANGSASVLLNVQHRMHPDISRWPNNQFYEGKLIDAPCTLRAPPPWDDSNAFEFFHVDNG
jgi:hypothetical protein